MVKKNLPIIFIHKGNSWYLPYVLFQTKKKNPDAPIYLIGDASSKHFSTIITHVNISEFKTAGNQLASVYRHKSTLGYDFEYLCIERWFILNQFMQTKGIDSCIYSDSDILMYADLSKHFSSISHIGMTWESFSAHTNFISNRSFLQKYCDLVIDLYSGSIFGDDFISKSHFFRINEGLLKMNISDMSFFYDYNILYPNELLHVDHPNEAGVIDAMLDDARFFEVDSTNFKVLTWINKIPYVTERLSNKQFQMLTLHFQGRGKQRLKQCFTEKSVSFTICLLNNNMRLLVSKILRKINLQNKSE